MRRLNKKKGIVLVTTMLSVVLVVMLLSAVVYSNMGSMRMTSNFYEREAAALAAESGIDYAVTRFSSDIKWKGDGIVPDLKGGTLQVSENDGNVIGIMELSGGRRAVFRIKFNYEDGSMGLDGLENSADPIESVNVSVNNLLNSIERKVYAADKNGTLKVEKKEQGGQTFFYPKDNRNPSFSVPAYSCCIYAEGFCGAATRNATLSNPIDFSKPYTRRVIESWYTVDPESLGSGMLSNSGANFKTLSNNFISSSCSDEPPIMGSLNELNVKSKNKPNFNEASLYYKSTNLKPLENDFVPEGNLDPKTFNRLKWKNIAKANDPGSSYETISAGTYAWCKNAVGQVELRRYSDYFPEGKKIPDGSKYEIISGIPGCTIDKNNYSMIFGKNIYVSGVAGSDGNLNKSFAVRSYINEFGTKPIVGFLSEDGSNSGIILSADGDISVAGLMIGRGSLTSAKNINIQGPSILESDPGIGVSIYAKENVTISSISNTTKEAEKNHPTKRSDGKGPVDLSEKRQIGDVSQVSSAIDLADKPSDASSSSAINAALGFSAFWSEVQNKNYEMLRNIMNGCIVCGSNGRYDIGKAYEIRIDSGNWCSGLNLSNYTKGSGALGDVYKSKDATKKHIYLVHVDKLESLVKAAAEQQLKYGAGLASEGNVLSGCTCGYCKVIETGKGNGQGNNDSCPINLLLKKAKDRGVSLKDSSEKEGTVTSDNSQTVTSVSDVQGFIADKNVSPEFKSRKEQQIQKILDKSKSISYSDQDISGVVYACGNVVIDVGDKSKVNISGSITAYGGDPEKNAPGSSGNNNGSILMIADRVMLESNPNYMNAILKSTIRRKLLRRLYVID